jgi:hypothetical protein
MARSLSQVGNSDGQKLSIETIDDEIAALLLAIEEEKVPTQLQELALKLQAALANRKSRETAN